MDGRHLEFADNTFDIAYSLSSIEHFGGVEGAGQTMREMARVIKPGGVLAIATEYIIEGPTAHETFQPGDIAELVRWSGLALVEPIDEQRLSPLRDDARGSQARSVHVAAHDRAPRRHGLYFGDDVPAEMIGRNRICAPRFR